MEWFDVLILLSKVRNTKFTKRTKIMCITESKWRRKNVRHDDESTSCFMFSRLFIIPTWWEYRLWTPRRVNVFFFTCWLHLLTSSFCRYRTHGEQGVTSCSVHSGHVQCRSGSGDRLPGPPGRHQRGGTTPNPPLLYWLRAGCPRGLKEY